MIINSIVRELKANGDMSMDYLSHNVSENLKRIRQSKGMSLDQVAEQTGVSKSMLAQIEKGTANPSIGVLGKITSGLRIEFQRLIDPPRVDYALISPDDLVPTKELLGQYRVWTCFPYEDSREVEVYRIDVEPGGVYTSGGHGEKTREYLTVTDGVLTKLFGHAPALYEPPCTQFLTKKGDVVNAPLIKALGKDRGPRCK